MKKAIVVGIMAVQVFIAHAAGESRVSCASEHVARGLAYCEQLRDGGKDAGLMAVRARIEFMLALKLDPRNSEAYYQLGCLYRDVFGYNEHAEEQFMLFFRLSDVSDGRRKKVQDKVLPELRKKISKSAVDLPGIDSRGAAPLSFDAANGLAQSLESSGRGKEALKYYRIACRLKPHSFGVLVKTGELAMKQGMPDVAADVFSRALATLPGSHAAVESLADALHKLKREDEAKAYRLYLSEIK